MRIYMNTTFRSGPFGGAGSFLQALAARLSVMGVSVGTRWPGKYDVALLNALTDGLNIERVKEIHSSGIPIVHRKTSFLSGGGEELRREVDGVIEGHRQQLEFSPFISHHIFQSEYSLGTFRKDGFSEENYSTIHNGVNEAIFNQGPAYEGFFLRKRVLKDIWKKGAPLRVLISSWSHNPRKGWEIYKKFDSIVNDSTMIDFIGRMPTGFAFEKVRTFPPMSHRDLAPFLRQHHALIFCGQFETCSNTIVEAINCGLPVIYLDSGANKELASRYGIEYRGDEAGAIRELCLQYDELQRRTRNNGYKLSLTASKYYEILTNAFLSGQKGGNS